MMGLVGIASLILIGYLLSYDRKSINWRTVFGAFSIQVAIALFVLYVPSGVDILLKVTDFIQGVMGYAKLGADFLFGKLGDGSLGFVFALNVLPGIVFFSALIAVLYYLGIMRWMIHLIGGALHKALGTSKPESMSAAANIFVGQNEAPLVVSPFVRTMTQSELFAIMVGGFASIAGSTMAGYAAIGIELKYLIAGSFMAAPAGLMMAKLLYPETKQPLNELQDVDDNSLSYSNIFDAAASGAMTGMQLAFNVGAMLLVFVSLIGLFNGVIGWTGDLVGIEALTFEKILGWVMAPIAWLIGIDWSEAQLAGSFIGQKIVVNEFVAYLSFIDQAQNLSPRAQAIIIFALCGFANFSSIAMMMGGLGALAPNRRKDVAKLGLRAIAAATLANLMSATLAGIFISI